MWFLACLYLQGGVAMMGGHTPSSEGGWYRPYDINEVRNPYGLAEIGCSVSHGSWQFELAARHLSSLKVDATYGDFNHQVGTNTVEARVRFYPFR